jgi:hypothetical protein
MTSFSRSCHHWVIGDVHGCADALERLVAQLPAGDRLVLSGDVINRGPQIRRTMELAWGLVESGRAVWLKGNHEADLVAALRQGDWVAHRALAGCDTYRQLGDRDCRLWQDRLDQLPCSYGRPASCLMFSLDGGQTWPVHRVISEKVGFNYTSIREISPGKLLYIHDAPKVNAMVIDVEKQ